MKKELIEKIMSLTHPTQDIAYVGKGFLQQILEEELPDFQRIDEERFKEMWLRIFRIQWEESGSKAIIDEYNSTLPPALVPLPKDMPKDFFRVHSGNDADDLWDWVVKHYGTPEPKPEYIRGKDKVLDDFCDSFEQQEAPAKPNLPSVEELAKEMFSVYNKCNAGSLPFEILAQHLISKYSLHPKQEWWMKLKKGDKFVYEGEIKTLQRVEVRLYESDVCCFTVEGCTPYTPPTAKEKLIAKGFTETEVEELIKEIKE